MLDLPDSQSVLSVCVCVCVSLSVSLSLSGCTCVYECVLGENEHSHVNIFKHFLGENLLSCYF